MSEHSVENETNTSDNDLLKCVVSLVCLFAADVQFLLCLKLIFIDKEFATLGLSLVLFLAFLLAFLIVGLRARFKKLHMLIAVAGCLLIALAGGLLIGFATTQIAYAVLIGVGSFFFGTFIYGISQFIRVLLG